MLQTVGLKCIEDNILYIIFILASLDKNEEMLSSSWQDIKSFAALRLLPNRMGDFENKNEDSKFLGKMLKPYGY